MSKGKWDLEALNLQANAIETNPESSPDAKEMATWVRALIQEYQTLKAEVRRQG